RGPGAGAMGGHALVRQPYVCGQLARLPEDVDRYAAARIPIAADAQEFRLEQRDEFLADRDGAILVEGADIAEAAEIELERLRLEEPFFWRVVDHEVRKIRLAGDRTECGEFRGGEPRHIVGVGMRIRHPIEDRHLRRSGETARLAEMTKLFGHCLHPRHRPRTCVRRGLIRLAPAYEWSNPVTPEFGRKRGSKRSGVCVSAAPFSAALQITGCPASTGHDKGVLDL